MLTQLTPSSIIDFLDTPYILQQEQIDFYQKNRFIKLKDVLNKETIDFFFFKNHRKGSRVEQGEEITQRKRYLWYGISTNI